MRLARETMHYLGICSVTRTLDAPQLLIGQVNLAWLRRVEHNRMRLQLPRIDTGNIRIHGDPMKPFQNSIENHGLVHLALTHA
jgi:hypothetical protein